MCVRTAVSSDVCVNVLVDGKKENGKKEDGIFLFTSIVYTYVFNVV